MKYDLKIELIGNGIEENFANFISLYLDGIIGYNSIIVSTDRKSIFNKKTFNLNLLVDIGDDITIRVFDKNRFINISKDNHSVGFINGDGFYIASVIDGTCILGYYDNEAINAYNSFSSRKLFSDLFFSAEDDKRVVKNFEFKGIVPDKKETIEDFESESELLKSIFKNPNIFIEMINESSQKRM